MGSSGIQVTLSLGTRLHDLLLSVTSELLVITSSNGVHGCLSTSHATSYFDSQALSLLAIDANGYLSGQSMSDLR